MRNFHPLPFCLIVLLLVHHVFAWSGKEHIQLTRLAIERVITDPTAPPALKAWLKQCTPDMGTPEQERNFFMTAKIGGNQREDLNGFSYWAIQPDVRSKDRTTLVPPLMVPEPMWHFLDMEYLNDNIDKRVYKADLSNAPDISKAPRDVHDERYKEGGVLPFAVEASYKELVQHIKDGKLVPPAGKPLDDDTALKWAASLAHYSEDNTQPLHGTQDYKCASYFENRRTAPNVHGQVEYAMVDDDKRNYPQLRADYWAEFSKDLKSDTDPVQTKDLFAATLQISATNYKTIPLIGLAAMAATGEGGTPAAPKGKAGPFDTEKFFRFHSNVLGQPTTYLEVKAHQQAWAVIRVAKLIRQAWDEAHSKA